GTEVEAVKRRGRDQQDRGQRRQNERDEVGVALEGGRIREARLERNGEQKREQHLNSWERNAELAEQLEQLAVDALAFALLSRHLNSPQRGAPAFPSVVERVEEVRVLAVDDGALYLQRRGQ